jgi:hypothetical protein
LKFCNAKGHPDKVCDRISDAVMETFWSEEENARFACETFATTNKVDACGEVGLSSEVANLRDMRVLLDLPYSGSIRSDDLLSEIIEAFWADFRGKVFRLMARLRVDRSCRCLECGLEGL